MTDADKVKQAQILKNVRNALEENLAAEIERAELRAQIRWMDYKAHIKAGFTPEQALELCK